MNVETLCLASMIAEVLCLRDLILVFAENCVVSLTFSSESFLCVVPPIITTCFLFHACQGVHSALNKAPRYLHGIQKGIRDDRCTKMVRITKAF